MTTARIIRRIWPIKTTCTAKGCGCTEWEEAGRSNGGSLRYRRCIKCCTVYSVRATHEERDTGGPSSVIVPA